MRVGVIGCGYWGAKHLRVLTQIPEVSLVVAIDARPDQLSQIQQMYPGALCASSLDDVYDLIDAAVVATPPRTHGPIARELLKNGKHVLVEKPMTASVAEALELIELAEKNNLTLMAGHTFAYNAAVTALKDLVDSGELGSVYYLDSARLNLGLYQPDVNVVWDLAPHDISIMNTVLGAEPTAVTAWGSRHAGGPFEDVAYLRLEYGTLGTTANLHVSWLDPCKVRRTTVVGSKRMAVYNDLLDDGRLRIYDKGVQALPANDGAMPMSYRYGGIVSPHIAFTEPLMNEDRHFVECVLTGARPRTDGYAGLAVVRVLEAAQESLATGKTVDLLEVSKA
ncbi:Gfo/Idh/MocA family protein [Longispora albida]|uniref:Gfo/Idh/MocA family protein n=1 Tax=Longispora albida TaxID=203523 RepID=UPI0004757B30|nr:Gfo/Idh/MocA family oxidoreductase [Longispora albida]